MGHNRPGRLSNRFTRGRIMNMLCGMNKNILRAIVLLNLATPAMADVEYPSARRLWLLCHAEDPQCGPMFADAMMAAYVNPVVRGTLMNVPDPKYVNWERAAMWFMSQSPPYGASAREALAGIMIYNKCNTIGCK